MAGEWRAMEELCYMQTLSVHCKGTLFIESVANDMGPAVSPLRQTENVTEKVMPDDPVLYSTLSLNVRCPRKSF
jgi:hypothetical protein